MDLARDLYFDDLSPGLSWETLGRTITEADVVSFACLSGDFNPIHVDAEFARGSRFGERVAHGLLGLSVASGQLAGLGFLARSVVAFMGLDWKFTAPIRLGDTVRTRSRVASTRAGSSGDAGVVVLDVQVLNQRDEVTQTGRFTLLVARRPAAIA